LSAFVLCVNYPIDAFTVYALHSARITITFSKMMRKRKKSRGYISAGAKGHDTAGSDEDPAKRERGITFTEINKLKRHKDGRLDRERWIAKVHFWSRCRQTACKRLQKLIKTDK